MDFLHSYASTWFMVGLISASTFFLQIPYHAALLHGIDIDAITKLVQSN